MKTRYNYLGQIAAAAGLLGVLLAASGSAMAASYNIILKTSDGAIQSCATGGFTFTKTTVGTFTATSPSVALNGTTATQCFGVDKSVTLSNGTLSVTVANVTVNGQDQGPNVVSINGNLSNGNANGSYTIHFLADKSFTITQKDGNADPQVGSGIYFIYNQNSVPEPETLWLALAGLSALVMSRRIRRRRS
ncbi:MAG: PEP-CTERM sorting domain-containing protein [Gammaproteobacteria bacterium]|nr:PEP-CTERM sorting domain-containing protein [Gammaproteobacteria bacterium]